MRLGKFALPFFVLLMSVTTHASVVCETLFETTPKAVRDLMRGARPYQPEADNYSLDGNTRHDLNVMQRIYPALNKTQTVVGAKRLAWLLEHPYLSASEIVQRQEVVKFLLANPDLRTQLREQLARLEGLDKEFLDRNLVRFTAPLGRPGLAIIQAVVTGVVTAGGVWAHSQGILMQMLQLTALFVTVNGQGAAQAMKVRSELSEFKTLFSVAQKVQDQLTTDSRVRELQQLTLLNDALAAVIDPSHAHSVSNTAARFGRMVTEGWGRRLMSVLDFFYGHTFLSTRRMQNRLIAERDRVALVLSAIAELDAYVAMAEYAATNQGSVTFPTIVDSATPILKVEDAHNPYLFAKAPEASVANNVSLAAGGGLPNFALLTGANAGGKSTYLKMIALNAVQAQIGAPVPARAFVFTPLEVLTNIDISDSLETGKSFFRAESARLATILERAAKQPKILVIMDEILLGTNPRDRHAVEEEVIRHLTQSGRLVLLATHDIALTRLSNEVPGITNLSVEEVTTADGNFQFTFKIIPGVSQTTTAFQVLRAEGVPADLVERALATRARNMNHDKSLEKSRD